LASIEVAPNCPDHLQMSAISFLLPLRYFVDVVFAGAMKPYPHECDTAQNAPA
jgi:hypothetical protein